MIQKPTLSAGVPVDYQEVGDFFRILAATADMTVTFYWQGREVAKAEGVSAGYAEGFKSGQFDKITIISATAQTIQFVTRLGNVVAYDAPPTGNVSVQNLPALQGAFTQANPAVTSASTQIMAANAARRYLLIQNNDATGDIYITLDGTEATVGGKGLKIAAGGSYEVPFYLCSGAIKAIGSIVNNANVVTVEG